MSREPVMTGLDISHWNNTKIKDWCHIVDEHKFVMLKYGGEEGAKGKLNKDPHFIDNYHRAKAHGLHVGCYFFMSTYYSVFKESPFGIVDQFLNAIDNYDFDMPIALDVEGQSKQYKTELTEYVREWCTLVEKEGYYVTIYGSDISTFKDTLELDKLAAFDKWVARYGKEPEYVKQYGMWQQSSSYICTGVEGRYDLDIAYYDYPKIIKQKGLNKRRI